MERCTLTQRPCRKAIAEVVEANKNRYFLQRTLEAAEILLQGSKEETRKKMSEEDEARFSLIWNALMMDDTDDIKRTLNLSDYLMLKRIKERAKAQKKKRTNGGINDELQARDS